MWGWDVLEAVLRHSWGWARDYGEHNSITSSSKPSCEESRRGSESYKGYAWVGMSKVPSLNASFPAPLPSALTTAPAALTSCSFLNMQNALYPTYTAAVAKCFASLPVAIVTCLAPLYYTLPRSLKWQ